MKVQWTPGDYTSKLNAGLLSSSGPDVFESSVNIDQVKSGQVVALDDIIADTKSDYTEADIKSSTVDGKIYQVKMVDDMGVLYYRKSILDKAGVTAPDHHRRVDRSFQGTQHEGPEGPVHRQ